jgi:hypothetical protein
MVAIEILGTVLEFAIDSLVEILQDLGTRRFRPLEVRIDMVDKQSQALRSVAEFCRTRAALSRPYQHDPGVAEMHLRAASRIAIAVVLGKTEGFAEPGNSFVNVFDT